MALLHRYAAKQACKHLRRVVWLQCGDEGVALESCEFWSAFCEASVAQPDRLNPEILRPFLGRLVPVLLKNMVSSLAQSTSSCYVWLAFSPPYIPGCQLAWKRVICPVSKRGPIPFEEFTQASKLCCRNIFVRDAYWLK